MHPALYVRVSKKTFAPFTSSCVTIESEVSICDLHFGINLFLSRCFVVHGNIHLCFLSGFNIAIQMGSMRLLDRSINVLSTARDHITRDTLYLEDCIWVPSVCLDYSSN